MTHWRWPWRAGWWLVWLAGSLCFAAPPPDGPAKYLFLVEASAVTAPHSERVALAVADLIERGLGGRMQNGDLFTILPFNEQVDPAGYRRQVWEPARSRPISNLAFLYLQKYKFEKKPRLDLALALAQLALREEGNITVYLIVGGHQPVLGTPFDEEINTVLREHHEAWRIRRAVCVIALVAERGRYRDWAVGTAEPPAPTRLAARMPEPPPPPPPAPTPAPPTNNIAAVKPKPPPPPPAPRTNQVTEIKPPPPSVKTNAVVAAPPPTPVQPEKIEPPPPPPATNTNAETAAKPPPPSPPPPKVDVPPAIARETSTTVVVTKPVPAVPATNTASLPVSPSPTGQVAVTTPSVAHVTNEEPPAVVAAPSPTNTAKPPPPAAVAVLPQPSPTPYGLILAGVGLLLLAIWLAVVWQRRTRPAPAPSLITQSMERERPRPPHENNP